MGLKIRRKKALFIILGVVAVLFVLNLFHVFDIFSCNPFANQAQVRFYDEIEPVNEEDSVRLRELLYGKPLHYDSPSCGFGEDVSVSFGGDTFMPARDGDDIVENNGKYLTLTKAENEEFHEILEKYGVTFPCV
ncbi:MAG: hypothetical protein II188_03560 [Ruminococcus sp.]|nr:hypothetical protein [Ruminococcus sp.]